jgi:hypothetical protein
LLVRKLARRGSAEGYRTNRSRIYWYNSFRLFPLASSERSTARRSRHVMRAHAGPVLLGMFVLSTPFPLYPFILSTSLFLLCSLLSRFSFPSPFHSFFQCSLFHCPVIVSGRLIVACCGGIAGPWATWSRQRKRELFFLLRFLFE